MLNNDEWKFNVDNFGDSIKELYEFLDGVLSPFFHHFGTAGTIFSVKDYDENYSFVAKNKHSPFCNYVRDNLNKKNTCIECDKRMIRNISQTKEPVIYWCDWGMRDIAVPIVIAGECVGAILCGQKRILNDAKEDNNGLQKMEAFAKKNNIPEPELIVLRQKRQGANAIAKEELVQMKDLLWATSQYISRILPDYIKEQKKRNLFIENILKELSEKLYNIVQNESITEDFWAEYRNVINVIKSNMDCQEIIVLLTENRQTRIVSSVENPDNIMTYIQESELITVRTNSHQPIQHLLVKIGSSNLNCSICQQIRERYPEVNMLMYKKSNVGFHRIIHFIFFFDSNITSYENELLLREKKQILSQLIYDTVNIFMAFEEIQKLKALIKEKEQLVIEKGQFLNDIVHQIGQPLHGIVSYIDMYNSPFTEPERKKRLLRYIQYITRITFVTMRGIEYIARGEISLEIDVEEVSLRKTLIEFAWILQGHSEAKKIQIHVNESSVRSIGMVKINKGYLEIAMINLLYNAVKYSFPETQITITALRALDDNKIYIDIENFGIQIPEDMQEKIFERGARVNEATKYCRPGLGIGLYITREILKTINGTIDVKYSIDTQKWHEKYPIYRNNFVLGIPDSYSERERK